MDALERRGGGDAAFQRKPFEERHQAFGRHQCFGEQRFGLGPDVVLRVVGEMMAGQVADFRDDVGLLHADALRDDVGPDARHAVLFVDALIGLCRQRLAVDQHAVAVEDDQVRVGHAARSFARFPDGMHIAIGKDADVQ